MCDQEHKTRIIIFCYNIDINLAGEPMKLPIQPNPTGNRLILLYLVSKMPAGLEHDDIIKLNLDGNWMLYFDLEQHLLELCEENLLSQRELDGRKVYAATAEGLGILTHLKSTIPLWIRTSIDEKVSERRVGLERELEITTYYSQDSTVEFPVRLKINENLQTLLEINMTAASAADAARVCERFRTLGEELYVQLLAKLTSDEEEPQAQ
jgi:hypothetical protein